MTLKHILPLAAFALPLAVAAQNTTTPASPAVGASFDFEGAQNWKALGVFDTWEASPFRTGKLAGNVAVVDNPTTSDLNPLTGKPVNPSTKVLAFQRSRFGSNTFGARIVLNEPIALSPTPLYIHAWVHSPKPSRVLIAGLGKRKDRAAQVDDVVQVAHITSSTLEPNQWKEIVVPAAANKGVELHSLLIVPDCESPHDLPSDFAVYIDNVEVNAQSSPTLFTGYYPIGVDKETAATRKDRHIDGVEFTVGKKTFAYTTPTPSKVYDLADASHRVLAKAGDEITPKLLYTGAWMHSFYYVDYNQDGKFTEDEVVSYSFKGDGNGAESGKNSAGQSFANGGQSLQSPKFTLRKDMTPGVYRMRVKVDYNNLDPMGSQSLVQDGGGFVDILLNIHEGKAVVNDHNLNGAVKTLDGKPLTSLEVPYGEDFTIKMHPADGFEHNGFVLKHGVDINGEKEIKDNVQWETVTIPRSMFKADGTFTIPGKWMNGNVLIEGRFVETGHYTPEPIPAWYARFNVTSIEGKYFAAGTQWYSLQIGKQGYVVEGTKATQISLNKAAVEAQNEKHQWCFVGNNDEGYKLYNRHFGTGFVLAAPTAMSAKAGETSFVRLVPADKVPSGYTAVWRFETSKDLNANDAQVVYMYEDKFPSNKPNNRGGKLAFWSTGADHGSTFVIRPLEITTSPVTALAFPTVEAQSDETYDLSGRRADEKVHGVLVTKGKKVLR